MNMLDHIPLIENWVETTHAYETGSSAVPDKIKSIDSPSGVFEVGFCKANESNINAIIHIGDKLFPVCITKYSLYRNVILAENNDGDN